MSAFAERITIRISTELGKRIRALAKADKMQEPDLIRHALWTGILALEQQKANLEQKRKQLQ